MQYEFTKVKHTTRDMLKKKVHAISKGGKGKSIKGIAPQRSEVTVEERLQS